MLFYTRQTYVVVNSNFTYIVGSFFHSVKVIKAVCVSFWSVFVGLYFINSKWHHVVSNDEVQLGTSRPLVLHLVISTRHST